MRLNQIILVLLCFMFSLPASLASADIPVVPATEKGVEGKARDEIKKRVASLQRQEGLVIGNCSICSETVLPALYERSGFNLLWTNQKSIDQLFLVLEKISADGLDANDYHLPLLKDLLARINFPQPASPSLLADFDLVMSDSLIRLGYHLLVGKVDPVELDNNWNMDRTVGDMEQILEMADAITQGEIVKLVQSMRPQVDIYHRLRSALARYRAIEAQGGWEPVSPGPLLKPGTKDKRVEQLRTRLLLTGDLQPEGKNVQLFDQEVEHAVILFQKRHGLNPDGIVGSETLQALNITVQERINQILVNLERARWVLHDLPDKFVLVDIAGFQVRLINDQIPVFETRAQVGTTYRKTPVFKSEIKFLVLNPTWTVPQTIFRDDMLPRLKEDADYLSKNDMRVITYSGRTVDQKTINWQDYPGSDFPYLLRQDPGPANALGRIKFMFPNSHDVYLHDTPKKSLFDQQERAFSSGCVRIEHPFRFAELLLDDGEWNQQKLIEVIDSRKTTQVSLNRPVPVLLLYWTVTVDGDENVIFKKDIYQRDSGVLSSLKAPFRFSRREILGQTNF